MWCRWFTVAGVPGRSRRGGGRPPPAWAGIALQGAHRGVAGPGQQQRQVGAILSSVGEGPMAQLMQRPPGARVEQLGRPPVRQPGPPASRVHIQAGDRAGRPAGGEKHRSRGPTRQQAGEQLRRPGLPEHPLDRPTLAANPRPPVGQIQVLHVQGQQLIRASGGLIQQPPQGSLAQREIPAGKQPVELTAGEGPGAVDLIAATLQAIGRVAGEPAAATPPANRGTQGGQLPVPRRRRRRTWRARNQPASIGPDSSPTSVAGPSSATRLASEAR